MIGIVGKIKFVYSDSEKKYEDIFEPILETKIYLSCNNKVGFKVEEVNYIEDTVYSVVLSLIEPDYMEDEFIVDGTETEFEVCKFGIKGKISLKFL